MAFKLECNEELSSAIDLVQEDRALGLGRLQALADAGNQSAIVHLGLYLSEDPTTDADAERWLRRAAQFESADAAWNLAMIERERGNEDGLRAWIDRAAEWGEPDSIEIRERGYDFGPFFVRLRDEAS